MADIPNLTKLVPGFEFLQSLAKTAGGAALPNMGQWIAPTLNPEEIEKRINELRTVQFWLEQNAKLLGATIQALEVQRMTLSTLKTMNVQMGDLRDALMIKPGAGATAAAAGSSRAAPSPPAEAKATGAASEGAAVQPVDPMQWWSAIAKQFTELATTAMKDGAGKAAETMTAMRAAAPDATAAASASSSLADAATEGDSASGEAAKSARKAAARKPPRG